MTQVRRPSPLQRRVLEQGGDAPVYGPNLRLAVELTGAGRAPASPLLDGEQARVLAEQRVTAVRVLPPVPRSQADEADDRPVELDGHWHLACRGDYVILSQFWTLRSDIMSGQHLCRSTKAPRRNRVLLY